MKHRVFEIIAVGVSLVSCWALPGRADYQPPASRTTPHSPTTTTGRRGGCNGEADHPLTILAPADSIGRSTSQYPRLMWYVPDEQSRQIQLRLYEMRPDGSRQRLQNIALASQQGFMEYQWPANEVSLEPDRSYLWQVVLFCDRNQPSSAIVSEAMMKIISLPEGDDPVNDLQNTSNTFQQLMESDRWYDALSVLSQLTNLQEKERLQNNLLQ